MQTQRTGQCPGDIERLRSLARHAIDGECRLLPFDVAPLDALCGGGLRAAALHEFAATRVHDTLSEVAHPYLLRARVRFLDPRGRSQPTPFSLMIVALGASGEQRVRLAAALPGLWLAPARPRDIADDAT